MSSKKIGIVGYGYVGKAIHEFFKGKYACLIHDPDQGHRATREEINACDLGVICVPTPALPGGSCDSSAVEGVVEWLETPVILIKSTVEPGTTQKLKSKTGKRIVFSPEYAGESSYWTPYRFHTDLKEMPFFTFGGDRKDCEALVDFYLPIAGPVKTYRMTDSLSAELAKYIENTFYAMKVAFCNEMYDLCEKAGSSWNEVRELWLLDPRINPMHTAVFKDRRGFSGKCLPKDTLAMIEFGDRIGVDLKILKSVISSNEGMLRKNSK